MEGIGAILIVMGILLAVLTYTKSTGLIVDALLA